MRENFLKYYFRISISFCVVLVILLLAFAFDLFNPLRFKTKKLLKSFKSHSDISIQDSPFHIEAQEEVAKIIKNILTPKIYNYIQDVNANRSEMSLKDIIKLDKLWREKATVKSLATLKENFCSQHLAKSVLQIDGLVEVFITGQKGMNICQSEDTSDIYQADEDWWLLTFYGGKGKIYTKKKLEFDMSAVAEVFSFHMPIYKKTTNQNQDASENSKIKNNQTILKDKKKSADKKPPQKEVIGVIKILLDADYIKSKIIKESSL